MSSLFVEPPLPARQLSVLLLIAEGCSNARIGELLDISPWTVKVHVEKLLHRLDATNRAHAVRIGFERGLLH